MVTIVTIADNEDDKDDDDDDASFDSSNDEAIIERMKLATKKKKKTKSGDIDADILDSSEYEAVNDDGHDSINASCMDNIVVDNDSFNPSDDEAIIDDGHNRNGHDRITDSHIANNIARTMKTTLVMIPAMTRLSLNSWNWPRRKEKMMKSSIVVIDQGLSFRSSAG